MRDREPHEVPATSGRHATRSNGPVTRPREAALLDLQRQAGNAATARAVGGPVTVQRHASFEHTLLGNTNPKDLGRATVDAKQRKHILRELWRQTFFFSRDAGKDPRAAFPDVKWIQLRGSGLWLSYGELNAMADYLPDAANIDGLKRNVVEPVLQRMRRGTSAQLYEVPFRGEASAGAWEVVEKVATEKALDKVTAPLGSQRYFGLLTRNACHFAPYSWHRWARFHEEATDHALTYYRNGNAKVPLKDPDVGADEHLRQAWLNNGYGDHFLQDSFAAGHLINKTLIMQWFVDYVNGLSSAWWDLLGRAWWGDDTKPWWGMPDERVMATMGSKQQPGMAGQKLYQRPTKSATTSADRAFGTDATDPQSSWERRGHEQRVGGSGVNATTSYTKEQNYQSYQRFLNSAFLNLAAGELHDYFNERGLNVANPRGDRMQVGGDATLLEKGTSGPLGAQRAAEAAQLSQTAINDLLTTGTTAHTVETISAYFPNQVYVNNTAIPLEQWHDQVLHDLCRKEIFPDVVDSFSSKVARAGQPNLLEGGTRDVPKK